MNLGLLGNRQPPVGPPTASCKHLLFRFVGAVFQGFAFLKDPENILEQLNIALVKAVPFTCLCSFNKHSLRACLVLDTGGQTTQPLAGNNMGPGQRCWGQGRKSDSGKADITRVDKCLAGRSPEAAGIQERHLTAREGGTEEGCWVGRVSTIACDSLSGVREE